MHFLQGALINFLGRLIRSNAQLPAQQLGKFVIAFNHLAIAAGLLIKAQQEAEGALVILVQFHEIADVRLHRVIAAGIQIVGYLLIAL